MRLASGRRATGTVHFLLSFESIRLCITSRSRRVWLAFYSLLRVSRDARHGAGPGDGLCDFLLSFESIAPVYCPEDAMFDPDAFYSLLRVSYPLTVHGHDLSRVSFYSLLRVSRVGLLPRGVQPHSLFLLSFESIWRPRTRGPGTGPRCFLLSFESIWRPRSALTR